MPTDGIVIDRTPVSNEQVIRTPDGEEECDGTSLVQSVAWT